MDSYQKEKIAELIDNEDVNFFSRSAGCVLKKIARANVLSKRHVFKQINQ